MMNKNEALDKVMTRVEADEVDLEAALSEAYDAGRQSLMLPADKSEMEIEVSAERHRQIEQGFTPKHDDEHGPAHLIRWAIEYMRGGYLLKAAALMVATLEVLQRRAARQPRIWFPFGDQPFTLTLGREQVEGLVKELRGQDVHPGWAEYMAGELEKTLKEKK